MKLNEYKISDFPNFDLESDSNNIRLDFPSLISDYIYDLEDGLNIKLHAEKEDEYGYLYDEFNLKDLQYYCDIKNLDYKFPKWIESLSIKVYQNNDKLEKDTEMNGFVNIPVDDKSDITYNPDTQKINISNFTVYSWKNKEYTKKVISHELTHCYDFYKKFITGDSTFNLVDKDGNWKSVYDLEHEDNLFLYGVKADEFRDQIKELDPDNYSLYKNKALEILKDSSLWKDNDNLSVFCLVVCELFYYLDTSEMKAFYVSGKDVKEIYQDIYNICSKFPDISDKMLRKLSENSELSDMFRKFIFNVLGIKLKNNLSEYLKEIQFELVDDAHDAVMLFKQNLLNEALISWNDSDIEDSGLINASDVKKQMNYQLIYKLDEPRRIRIFGGNYTEYKDKVYIEGEYVQLKDGCTVKEYKPGEYRVYIEDFDKIADFTFYECTELISIIIPNSVTSIGEHAFRCCRGLTSIIIPDKVTLIGESAFYYCTGLTSVTIGNSVTSIDYGAFSGCSGLTSVTIPNSVKSICGYVFRGCTGLTSATISDSVKSIGSYAFYECENLKKVYVEDIEKFKEIEFGNVYSDPTCYSAELIELKKDLNEALLQWDDSDIEDSGIIKASDVENRMNYQLIYKINEQKRIRIFYTYSYSIKFKNKVYINGEHVQLEDGFTVNEYEPGEYKIYIEDFDKLKKLKDFAFYECTDLMSIIIPNSVTTIGESAFYDCNSLTSVTIPNSVTLIDGFAFDGCNSLTSVTIPDSVKKIGKGAFFACTELISITLPKTISIGEDAFWGCLNLKKKLNEALLQWNDSDIEDTGIIKASDVEKKIKIPKEFIGRERPNSNGELYILIGDIRNTLGPGTKENPIDLNWIDLSMINQGEWTNNINGIFGGNANGTFEYIDISKWDVSGIKSIADLFYNNEYIKSVGNLSKWQTSNIENMHRAFCGCINLEYIGDLSNWKLDNVKDISQMFCHTHKLKWVGDLSSWTSTVESLPNVYKYGCIAYAGFNPDKFDWPWLFRKKPVVESLLIDWDNDFETQKTNILNSTDISDKFTERPILTWNVYMDNLDEVKRIVQHIVNIVQNSGITELLSMNGEDVFYYKDRIFGSDPEIFQWPSTITSDTAPLFKKWLEKNKLLTKEDLKKYERLVKLRNIQEECYYLEPILECEGIGTKEYDENFDRLVNIFEKDPNISGFKQLMPEDYLTITNSWNMYIFQWNKPINGEYLYFYICKPIDPDNVIDTELSFMFIKEFKE